MKLNIETSNFLENIERWKEYYFSSLMAKGTKKETITLYNRNIKDFSEYLYKNDNNIQIIDVNRQFIQLWLNYLLYKLEFKKSTVNIKLITIKSFFLFITQENDELIDFMRIFRDISIKQEKNEKTGYSENDLEKVLKTVESFKDIESNRYADAYIRSFMFKAVYFTGIRASELLDIKREDIESIVNNDKEFYRIKINGKGSKERLVYIVKSDLEDEINYIDKQNIKGFICVTKKNTRYSRQMAHKLFDFIFSQSKVQFNGVHSIRHSFARRLVQKNINLSTIQELLGHSDIKMTASIYAKSNESNKMGAVSR